MDLQRRVARLAVRLERRIDRIKDGIGSGSAPRPARVVPYRGYGTKGGVRIRGRVLYGEAPAPATPDDGWWVNFGNTVRRMETDEVAGARVRVRFGGAEAEGRADEEGHFDLEVRPTDAVSGDRFWHQARVDLVEPEGTGATAMVAVPAAARFGIISDLDDTVLRTDATNVLRVAREVLFGNVHTRIPFPGVGSFYRALHIQGERSRNPLFYVSSSPWNLYDLLNEFLRLHGIPAGPMDLRDWGLSEAELLPTGHTAHKRLAIDRILETYPDLRFLFIGDSGQEDPEIYRGVVHDHPERVLGIYIRSVVEDPARIEAVRELSRELDRVNGVDLVLVENTVDAARDAAGKGWIDPAALPGIARSREREDDPAGPP